MKKHLKILFIFIAVFMLTACSIREKIQNAINNAVNDTTTNDDTNKIVESDFEITGPTGFEKKSQPTMKYYYENNTMNIGITVNSESKALFEQYGIDYPEDVKAYAEFVANANGLPDAEIVTRGNYAQFSYTKTINGYTYYYYGTTHKSNDAYWMINFFCFEKDSIKYLDMFREWADSIIVK